MLEDRFQAPEILFKASLIGEEHARESTCPPRSVSPPPLLTIDPRAALHEMLHATIQSCDVDLRRELYANVILSGGTTLTRSEGMKGRRRVMLFCHTHPISPTTRPALPPHPLSNRSDFPKRLLDEMRQVCAPNTKIRIFAPPERMHSAWIGGCVHPFTPCVPPYSAAPYFFLVSNLQIPPRRCILASLTPFQNMWITKKEYEEEGERCLLSKTLI